MLATAMVTSGLRFTTLILAQCRMPSEGIKELMDTFRNIQEARDMLEHLDLSRNEVRPDALKNLRFPRLKYLDLSADVSACLDTRAADVATTVASTMIHGGLPVLESLYLHWASVHDIACDNLAKALASERSPHLKVLEVDVDCDQGVKGWRRICEGVKRGPRRLTVSRLKLSHDEPSKDAVRAVAELLLEGACENLIDLDLHGSNLGDEKLGVFLGIIKNQPRLHLKKLSLSQNSLKTISALALAHVWEDKATRHAWDGLEELNLEDNEIDCQGGMELARYGGGVIIIIIIVHHNGHDAHHVGCFFSSLFVSGLLRMVVYQISVC